MKAYKAMERAIAKATIAALLAAGYKLSVDNQAGDEDNVRDFETLSTDGDEIFGRMFLTDEDYIFVFEAAADRAKWDEGAVDAEGNQLQIGWVRFTYGNDGWDVISDYTTNLAAVLGDNGYDKPATGVMLLTEKLESGDFEIVV